MKKDLETLSQAFNAWQAASNLRQRRQRQKRYTYGEQWIDIVDDHKGNICSEYELLIKEGRRPLTNNLLRRMVKSIIGLYRSRSSENNLYDSDQSSIDYINQLSELDARMLEEYIISGCAIQRVADESRTGVYGVWIDNVDPRKFFVNSFSDPRGYDIDFIGMLHDMSWPQLVNRFAKGKRTTASELKNLLVNANNNQCEISSVLGISDQYIDFLNSKNNTLRVIETWHLVGRPVYQRGRIRMEMKWQCRWLSSDGYLLDEYYSYFKHGSHPFVVKFFPLIDGEVHSFVEDVIDQQRTVNRHLVLADSILASSAKGTLLFPVGQLPKGVTLKDVEQLWSRPDSIIPIVGDEAHKLPTQVVSQANNSPAYNMLDLHMQLFDKTSGVTDALLGQNISASTGANLYDAQVKNSSTILCDLLDSFSAFTIARNTKAHNTI